MSRTYMAAVGPRYNKRKRNWRDNPTIMRPGLQLLPRAVSYRWPRAPLANRGFYGSSVRAREELKVVDTATAAYAIDTTGSVTLVNGVATGTDFTNRIGRKVLARSVLLQGLIEPGDTTTADNLARIMLVWDTQPNGATPAITDFLTASDSYSPMNLNNRDRFRIICDVRRAVAAVSNVATQSYAGGPTVHAVKQYRKINKEVIFSGTGSTVGSIQTGAMWLVTIGNQSAASSLGATFVCTIRFRFADA